LGFVPEESGGARKIWLGAIQEKGILRNKKTPAGMSFEVQDQLA
jgi:hypothetical protein